MTPRNPFSIISANGMGISYALVLAALSKADLRWEMHRTQVFALERLGFSEHAEILDSKTQELCPKQTRITLMGIPVVIDNERYPKGLIRLMSGEKEISRIEFLAIPNELGYVEHLTSENIRSEREKFIKLTYTEETDAI